MRNRQLFIFLIVWLGTLGILPVEAHRPYAQKIHTIASPAGGSLILEKLYGDGIFFADPVRLQIRNENGVVLAHSRTSSHVSVFCPSVSSCWAFPYDGLLVEPMRLDPENLQYDKLNENGLPADLKEYMAGSVNTVRSSGFVYPSFRDEPQNFVVDSPTIKLLSPLIIIADNLLAFLILAAVYFLPSFLLPVWWSYSLTKTRVDQLGLTVVGILMALPFATLILGVTFIDLFTLSMPFVYTLLIAGLSLWAGYSLSKNWCHRLLSKSHTRGVYPTPESAVPYLNDPEA